VLVERRLLGFFQSRVGPNRVGPFGLIQPIADGLKLFLKEDISPPMPSLSSSGSRHLHHRSRLRGVRHHHFRAPYVTGSGAVHPFVVRDIDLGILFLLSITSLGVFGIVLAGWSSGSKYPLFGSLRSASQMLSYEIPLTLSVLSVVLMAGSFRLSDIVEAQSKLPFALPLVLAFGVYVISVVARRTGSPSTCRKARASWWAGFHTNTRACASPSTSWASMPTW